MMASPWNNLNVIMQNEDYTNAIWNYILNQAFPAPNYIIVSELRFPNDHGWVDLAVMRLGNPDRLILVYEGKRTGGQFHTIHHALAQALACAKAYGNNHNPALIAALGTSFIIAQSDGTPSTAFNANQNGISDITYENNWNKIAARLVQIEKCWCIQVL